MRVTILIKLSMHRARHGFPILLFIFAVHCQDIQILALLVAACFSFHSRTLGPFDSHCIRYCLYAFARWLGLMILMESLRSPSITPQPSC